MKRILRALAERAYRLVSILLAAVHAIRLLFDPNRLGDVFVLDRAVTTPESLARIMARLRLDPDTASALRARRRLTPVDLERLAGLSPGTLGRTFADFMRARGLDPKSIPRHDDVDEPSFVHAHLYETHDLWHVVTGFDTDVAGELGVQAFYSAQLDSALARYLLIGGLLNSRMRDSEDWPRRLDAIARGWALGKRARPLFGRSWDDLWAVPLAEIRARLGIEPERARPILLPLTA
jgi:ubiquinone biosynthesis protein Coq4